MADGPKQAISLSVGSTKLTAVTTDNAVARPPVLSLFTDRPPALGQPEPGALVIRDFVDRVGDPVGILASDGSSHRSEKLLADALRALAYTATGNRPLPEATAVTHPAHWRPAAVEALRRALGRVPEWSHEPALLVADTDAALTALHNDPGLPGRGVVAVCDFGGSGTSVTLVDAAGGYRPIGPTVRHLDFSGDLIDQALLTHVIGDLATAGSVDLASTSAIGSLVLLRDACRGAKERLSATAVTSMTAQLPGFRSELRLTRTELDDAIRAPLDDVLLVIEDTMRRAGVRPTDLAAVATVGGGAAIVAVTTTLSEHFRVPVITTPRPAMSATIGAALRVLRGPSHDNASDSTTALASTALAPEAVAAEAGPGSSTFRALAWSEADDVPDVSDEFGSGVADLADARPPVEFSEDEWDAAAAESHARWYRSPLAIMVASIVVILAAVGGVGVVLTNDSTDNPSTPAPSVSGLPAQQADAPRTVEALMPPEQIPAPAQQAAPAPLPRTITAVPAPVTQVIQRQAPPVTVEAPAPAPADPPPAAVTQTVTETVAPPTSEVPPPSQPPPSSQAPVTPSQEPAPARSSEEPTPTRPRPRLIPTIPPIPTIPGLPPFIPQPGSAVQQP